MNSLFLFFLITGIIVILFLFIEKKYYLFISNLINIYDKPDGILKKHETNTPILGGLYLLFSTIILIFFFNFVFKLNFNMAILNASFLVFIIGIIDDKYFLSANTKLLIIILILIILYYNTDLPKINILYFATWDKYILVENFNIFLSIFCIILLINAFNMTDGINSLSTGIAIIWISFIIFFSQNELKYLFLSQLFFLIIIFNKIFTTRFFLGDSGTLFLATYIGLILIDLNNQHYNNKILPAELIFILLMLPGFDMLRLFLKRILNKKNPLKGDRNHLHHLLIKKLDLKKALIIYYLMIMLPILASLLTESYLFIILLFILFYALIIYFLNYQTRPST